MQVSFVFQIFTVLEATVRAVLVIFASSPFAFESRLSSVTTIVSHLFFECFVSLVIFD